MMKHFGTVTENKSTVSLLGLFEHPLTSLYLIIAMSTEVSLHQDC